VAVLRLSGGIIENMVARSAKQKEKDKTKRKR
jgi:hypothetical protein